MRILSLLFLLSMSALCAPELFEKIQDEEEVVDGITANTWRLTVNPSPGQLVMTTFTVEVGDDVEGSIDLESQKVEMIHYVPGGDFVQKVGYMKYWNEDREVHGTRFYKKWIVSGFGQKVTLGPMIHLGDGGGSWITETLSGPYQRVSRRFRFSNSDADFLGDGGSSYEHQSRHIIFKFEAKTVPLDDAVARAAEAGINKLPELKGESWSITLPQAEQAVERDAAEESAAAPRVGD